MTGPVVLDLATLQALVVDTDDGPALQLGDLHSVVLVYSPAGEGAAEAIEEVASAALEYGQALRTEAGVLP